MKLAATIIFLASFLLESSVTTIPLVFLTLLCFSIFERKEWVFLLALIAGVILDALSFRSLGQTSLFFTTVIILVILYEKKFEIDTVPFVFISSFLGSFSFLIIFSYRNSVILESFLSAIIGVIIFEVFLKLKAQSLHSKLHLADE